MEHQVSNLLFNGSEKKISVSYLQFFCIFEIVSKNFSALEFIRKAQWGREVHLHTFPQGKQENNNPLDTRYAKLCENLLGKYKKI